MTDTVGKKEGENIWKRQEICQGVGNLNGLMIDLHLA